MIIPNIWENKENRIHVPNHQPVGGYLRTWPTFNPSRYCLMMHPSGEWLRRCPVTRRALLAMAFSLLPCRKTSRRQWLRAGWNMLEQLGWPTPQLTKPSWLWGMERGNPENIEKWPAFQGDSQIVHFNHLRSLSRVNRHNSSIALQRSIATCKSLSLWII